MRRFKTKKGIALIAVVVAVTATAIGAYAFITAGGTGSGTATAGSANGVTINVGTIPAGLVPGGSVTVPYTITNTNSTASVVVTGISSYSTSQSNTTCNTGDSGALNSDFTYTDAPGNGYPITLAPGATSG